MAAKVPTIKIETSSTGNLIKAGCLLVIAGLVIWFIYSLIKANKDKRPLGKSNLFGKLFGHGSGSGSDSTKGDPKATGADANNPGNSSDLQGTASDAAGAAAAAAGNFSGTGDATGQDQGSGSASGNGSQMSDGDLAQLGIMVRRDGQSGYQYTDNTGTTWYGSPDFLLNIATGS